MSLKSLFSNLFFIKKKINKVELKDSYCYSDIIWNYKDNLIILISYSEDYNESIIEILDAANQSNLTTKIVYSSYDEETDKKDEDGNNIWLIHKKHYLLIGGNLWDWNLLYCNINNLGNSVLDKISEEITNNCCSTDFEYLINDGVLMGFRYNKVKPPTYDKPNRYRHYKEVSNIQTIVSRLPDAFKARDLIHFIIITENNKSYTMYGDIISNIRYMDEKYFYETSDIYCMYKPLFKTEPTVAKLVGLIKPLYKQIDLDDDFIPGNISDESLDEIFREHYERFSAIRDDDVIYDDIDELLDENEETENINERDVIKDESY